MRRTASVFAAALVLPAVVAAGPADNPGQRVDVIVVLEAGQPADVAADHGVELAFVYEHALNGFAGSMPEGRLNGLRNDRRVDYVEFDGPVSIQAQQVPTGIDRIIAPDTGGSTTSGTVNVDVAVIDTGIDMEHPDLNVVGGVDCLGQTGKGRNRAYTCVEGGDDDHYHGTHVAGTIGAIDNLTHVIGVAPGARLYAVKVLDRNGSGSHGGVIAGIDWVAANAATIDVANMSLGGSGFSRAEYDAIQAAVDAGVAFAVAAGNESDDANNYSPGGFDNVLSVSALADFNGVSGGGGVATCRLDEDDTLANFSNFGPEVDVIAPGVCITSTYPLDVVASGLGTISGTSMASPHVAGALALLAAANPSASVSALYAGITSSGTCGWDSSDDPDGLKEPLLDISSFPTLSTGAPRFCTPDGGGSGGGGGGGGGGEVTGEHAEVSYDRFGGRAPGKHLGINVTLLDEGGLPVAGQVVSVVVTFPTGGSGSASATTGSDGVARFESKNAPEGCYSTDVFLGSGSSAEDIPEEPTSTNCP